MVYGKDVLVFEGDVTDEKRIQEIVTKALMKFSSIEILVNSVCPGSVSPSDNPDVNYYKESDLSFMGRTGTDMENANLIAFLASDEASYISGQNIQIDGCRKKQ